MGSNNIVSTPHDKDRFTAVGLSFEKDGFP